MGKLKKRKDEYFVLVAQIIYEDGSEELAYYVNREVSTSMISRAELFPSLWALAKAAVCFSDMLDDDDQVYSYRLLDMKVTADDLRKAYRPV